MPADALGALPLAATGEAAKSGPLGLAVILFFCVACYFLFKSMSKHLRKVREGFPVDSDHEEPSSVAESAPAPAVESGAAAEPASDAGPVDPVVPDGEPPVQAATDTERPTAAP